VSFIASLHAKGRSRSLLRAGKPSPINNRSAMVAECGREYKPAPEGVHPSIGESSVWISRVCARGGKAHLHPEKLGKKGASA